MSNPQNLIKFASKLTLSGDISSSSTAIPVATTTTIGGVKVDGTSITINGSGVISGASTYTLPATTTTTLGGVIIPVVGTSGITNTSGTIGLATASTTQLGGVKVDGTSITINASGVISGSVAASALTGTTLASSVTASSLTSVGTLTSLTVSGTTTLSSGTANGVLYLDGSKAATNGSALTFDGTNLGLGNAPTTYKFEITTSGNNGLKLNTGTAGADQLFFGNTGGVPAVGTLSSSALTFIYGGSEGMRLNNTGLGIGTSSPSDKLTVQGNIRTTDGTNYALFVNNYLRSYASGTFYFDHATVGQSYVWRTSSASALDTTALTLNSSGNLGLGVTPSAWNGVYRTIQIGKGASISGRSDENTWNELLSNAYRNSSAGWTYLNTDYALAYRMAAGTHQWYTAPSGTAGNAISFTQAMTLDASGNLLVGTTTNTNNSKVVVNGVIESTTGGVKFPDGTTQTSAATSYTLPTASTTQLGGVKIDGTSITINGSGVISSTGGGGGGVITLTKQLNYVGPVNVANGTLRWYPDSSITITTCFISAGTAPSNGPLTLVIRKNGTISNTINLSSGQNLSGTTTLNLLLTTSDYLTVDVTVSNNSFDATLTFSYTRN